MKNGIPYTNPLAYKVLALVCDEFDLLPKVVRGKSRVTNTREARHVLCYILLATNKINMSTNDIYPFVGYANHTLVLHAQKTVQVDMDMKRGVHKRVLSILEKL